MKPKLKPVKPYRFRVIICDDEGNQVNDDVARIEQIVPITESLVEDLNKKREGA
ncbi:hypothetical protein ES705_17408 [subsurface metagenome]